MNKLAIFSLLVICVALAAGARGDKRRQRGGNRKVQEDIESVVTSDPPSSGRRGGKRRRQEASSTSEIVENAESAALVFDSSSDSGRGGRGRASGPVALRAVAQQQVFTTTTPFFSTSTFVPVARAPLRRRGNGVRSAQRVIERENLGQQAAGAAEGAVAQSSLKAGERNLDSVQALLQKKQARQERIDAKSERQSRRKEAARLATGEKVQAQSALDYETYENAEDFHDLNAAASKDIQNNFGLQIVSSNSHKEDAAISESSGSKYASGTKLQAQSAVDAETFVDEEALYESESAENELLDAEAAYEDILNAQEQSRVENEATIDAQNFQQSNRGFRESEDFFGNQGIAGNANPFGGNDIFGNGGFGSVFKRR